MRVWADKTVVAFEEVVDAEFIGLVDGSALQEHISDHAKQLGKRLNYRVRLRSFDAVCRMVESGVGVGIIPKNAAMRSMKSLKIRAIDISDQWAARKLVICARSIDALPQYLKEFVEFIAAQDGKRTALVSQHS